MLEFQKSFDYDVSRISHKFLTSFQLAERCCSVLTFSSARTPVSFFSSRRLFVDFARRQTRNSSCFAPRMPFGDAKAARKNEIYNLSPKNLLGFQMLTSCATRYRANLVLFFSLGDNQFKIPRKDWRSNGRRRRSKNQKTLYASNEENVYDEKAEEEVEHGVMEEKDPKENFADFSFASFGKEQKKAKYKDNVASFGSPKSFSLKELENFNIFKKINESSPNKSPYIIDGRNFWGVDPFSGKQPMVALSRNLSIPSETAIDCWLKSKRKNKTSAAAGKEEEEAQKQEELNAEVLEYDKEIEDYVSHWGETHPACQILIKLTEEKKRKKLKEISSRAAKERAAKERAANEGAANEGAANEGAAKERAANEGAANEGAANEGAANEGAANERAASLLAHSSQKATHDICNNTATLQDDYAQAEEGDIMDGHNSDYIKTVDGDLVFHDYIPGYCYIRFPGYYNYTVRNNIYMNGSIKAEEPSFIVFNKSPHRCTGKTRDLHRATDTGEKQQKRWGIGELMSEKSKDIIRGNFTRTDDYFKKLLYSIDWERPYHTFKDKNYFKRTPVETGYGDPSEERTDDSYFDVQFIGSTCTYPQTYSVGSNFTWIINWIPWLCKKHPRLGGQPIKSPPFNLGGIEPLQVWFYPAGCMISEKGYSAMKLVSLGGWSLPYKINISVSTEYGNLSFGPFHRNTKSYLLNSLNLCRFIPKSRRIEGARDMYLGPSGNAFLTVCIADSDYEWDDSTYVFEQWLKKQSARSDPEFLSKMIPEDFTHSEQYENFKYKTVPDKHFSKYQNPHLYYTNATQYYTWTRNI